MGLKHHATLQTGPLHSPTIHEHMARSGLVQTSQDIQDGGLATTRMANDANKFAPADLKINPIEHRPTRDKAFGQALDL